MNLRARAFIGLLCVGLATAQLNYRPEFISAGQGFQSKSISKRQAPGGDGADVIPHDMKKQTTFWWVAPDSPFKATKIGGGVQEPPGGGQDAAAVAAAAGAAGQTGAFGATQSNFQSTATRTFGAGAAGQSGQVSGGATASVQSATASRTIGSQTGIAGQQAGTFGAGRTTISRTSTATTRTFGAGAAGAAGQFGQTTNTQTGATAARTNTFSSTSNQVSTGTAPAQPTVTGGVRTTSSFSKTTSTTSTGVAPVPVPGQTTATSEFNAAGVRTDTATTSNTNTAITSTNTQQQPPPFQTNTGTTSTFGTASRTTVTGTRTGLPPSPILPSPGAGSTVTRTQERTGTGLTSHTITTGVNVQPFFKKTTVTSSGYDYPVPATIPCYEASKVCTPNEFCVNGFVEEEQLNQFNTNNQNCNSATEQCCKIRPTPPATQCPDDSYVCVSPSLCNNGLLNFDAQNAISSLQPNGQCFSPEVCCRTQSLISESSVLTNEGYVVRVPNNQYLPPEGANTNTDVVTAPPPPPPPRPTTPRPPPPPTPTRYIPPQTTTRYVPPPQPPTPTRYVPPQTTTRYFPPPPPSTTRPPYRGDEYVPPREEVPASSNDDPNAVRPPQDEVPNPANDTPIAVRPSPPPRPVQPPPVGGDAPPPLPPIGCSAAMNCTETQFCSSTGVISKTPVTLTPEQELFRVPVTECRSPDRGFTGVCCRDPDYVDPWPVGLLGLYNPELLPFDDGSYKPNGNNGNGNGNSVTRNEGIQGAQSRVTPAFAPNQLTSASQSQFTQTKSQYDRGATAAASSTSTTTVQQQQYNGGSTGSKRFTAGGLQFVHSGNTKFKPFQKQGNAQCAPRNYNTQPRGAGQWDTGFGEFPWQAMVILESNKSLLCGGAIISENTVATAANCVYGLNPRDVMIKGGEWRLGVDAEPKTFQIVRVKNVIYHPAYQPATLNYDVALLVLEDRLRYDTHIGAICLDENDVVPSASYENCVTTGWGREVLRIHIGNALMHYMPISLLSESESQRQLSANGFTPESHICGRPTADACEVDIGSALACADTSGTYYLKGIYSADNGCGRPDQVVSFTNIDVQWIRQALKNPNAFITPIPNYQPAANSPVVSVQQLSTFGPNKAYLPPYK
ncbi:mucin-5AC [Sabethes cyaneus]|uniref:mucin-5AC n=1 Tax=Sabethes cyaneus TaxID=53552 RepID=UPI00237DEB7E|nr:mucin-5AC [Sabethes cyaneus]